MGTEDVSGLSIVDSSGRQVSLLNQQYDQQTQEYSHQHLAASALRRLDQASQPLDLSGPMQVHDTSSSSALLSSFSGKRKYVCNEPGCFKSFTTSGHLARHHRIHTGEKNFPCLYPGCQSRFSRQDNMMQHYRTHMSPKSRRTKKPDVRSQPRLHAHHRILSDATAPLTIDQHLRNYHQSRLYQQLQDKDTSASPSPSTPHPSTPTVPTTAVSSSTPSPLLGPKPIVGLSSQALPPLSQALPPPSSIRPPHEDTLSAQAQPTATHTPMDFVPNHSSSPTPPPSSSSSTDASPHLAKNDLFFSHRPLCLQPMSLKPDNTSALVSVTTLLNPAHRNEPSSSSASGSNVPSPTATSEQEDDRNANSLIHLANIVSSFT